MDMEGIGFVKSGLLLKCTQRGRRVSSCERPVMAASKLSRRQVGQLVLGTSAILVADWCHIGQVLAASEKKPPNFIKDESGIRYYDVLKGTGSGPAEGDFVVVDYMAFLSNGKIFDSRKGFVFQMGRRQVIPGLESAVYTMKPGGERKVVVPPSLAYGDKGVCLESQAKECLVPPGETLGFSVTLLRVAVPPA